MPKLLKKHFWTAIKVADLFIHCFQKQIYLSSVKQGLNYTQGGSIEPICIHEHYSKTCVKQPHKNSQNKDLYDKWKLNASQKYCRMLPWSILQYFWPALSDNWPWKPIFGLFDSNRFTQVLPNGKWTLKHNHNLHCMNLDACIIWNEKSIIITLPCFAFCFAHYVLALLDWSDDVEMCRL